MTKAILMTSSPSQANSSSDELAEANATTVSEPLTCFNDSFSQPRLVAFAGGQLAYFTARAADKSAANEDALGIIPLGRDSGTLVLADGCGGEANGREAAKRSIEAVVNSVVDAPSPKKPKSWYRNAIVDGIEEAFHQVERLGGGAASTLLVVELRDHQLRTYHAGDSQAVLFDREGLLLFQTVAHSPVGYALEAGMLSEVEALAHEELHVVSNVIGSEQPHIDLGLPQAIDISDTLLLASDGVFDNLTLEELARHLCSQPLDQAAEALQRAVEQRMAGEDAAAPCKPDDCSFMLFRPAGVS